MIEKIDSNVSILLKYRDSAEIVKSTELRASICTLIEKCYFLESVILSNKKFEENSHNQFFTAKSAVNRYYRDWGLDEVADIYNELCSIAEVYLIN